MSRTYMIAACPCRFREHLFGWRQENYNLYQQVDTLFWDQVRSTGGMLLISCRAHRAGWMVRSCSSSIGIESVSWCE
jgi:hypothetical protein